MKRRGICRCGHEGPLTADGTPFEHRAQHVRMGEDGRPAIYRKPGICPGVNDLADLLPAAAVPAPVVFTPPARVPAPLESSHTALLLETIAEGNAYIDAMGRVWVRRQNRARPAPRRPFSDVMRQQWAVLTGRRYRLTEAGEQVLAAHRKATGGGGS